MFFEERAQHFLNRGRSAVLKLLGSIARDARWNSCLNIKPVCENPLRTAGQQSLVAHNETAIANSVRPCDHRIERRVGRAEMAGIDLQPVSNADGERRTFVAAARLYRGHFECLAVRSNTLRAYDDADSERAIRLLIALMVLSCDPLAIALTAAASARRSSTL